MRQKLILGLLCILASGCVSGVSSYDYSIAPDDCDIADPDVPDVLLDSCDIGISDLTGSVPVRQMAGGFDRDGQVYMLMVQSSAPISKMEAVDGEVVKITTHVGIMVFPIGSPDTETFSLITTEGKEYSCTRARGTAVIDC